MATVSPINWRTIESDWRNLLGTFTASGQLTLISLNSFTASRMIEDTFPPRRIFLSFWNPFWSASSSQMKVCSQLISFVDASSANICRCTAETWSSDHKSPKKHQWMKLTINLYLGLNHVHLRVGTCGELGSSILHSLSLSCLSGIGETNYGRLTPRQC